MKKYDKKSLVRLTSSELEKIHEKAKKANLSVSRFFVKSALSDGRVLTAEETEELQQLRHEVRRIGINLNQIARSLNTWERGQGEKPSASEIEATEREINKVLKALLNLVK